MVVGGQTPVTLLHRRSNPSRGLGGLEVGVGGGGVFVAVWRMLSRSRRDGKTLCESRADKGMQGTR